MFKYWLGNDLLIEFILDVGNYAFFCTIFLYFNKKKLISKSLLLILCLFLLTPFLFNNSLFPWTMNPDQVRYLGMANQFRENISLDPLFNMTNQTGLKVIIPGYIFAFSPMLSVETFKSIGFLNRFFLLGSIAFFLKKKKISPTIFLIILLSPSLTYFSSISLRDVLVLIFMLWSVYYYLEGKKVLFLLFCLLVAATKPQNLIIIIFFIYLNEFFESKNKKMFSLISILIIAPIIMFMGHNVIDKVNQIRLGLFAEAYGSYRGISSENTYTAISLNWELLVVTTKSFFLFLLAPLLSMTSMMKVFIIIECFVLYYIFLKGLILSRSKKHFRVAIIWLIVFLFSFLMYAVVLFNDGTIHRYRLVLIYFVLIGYSLHKSVFLKKKYE